MKKLLVALAFLAPTLLYAQRTENDPIYRLKNAIYHATILAADNNLRNFLLALDDTELRNGFTEEVVEDGKKEGLSITAIYRGNTIEYSYAFDSLLVKVSVNIKFGESARATDVQFFSRDGKLYGSDWFYVPQNWSLSKVDSVKDFIHHSRIALRMMKGGLRPTDVLIARLIYNMNNDATYYAVFKYVAENEGLRIIPEGNDVWFASSKRAYQVIYNGKLQWVFDVRPQW